MADKDIKSKPAPLETDPGEQQDDNIDDLGDKHGGGKQEQPGGSGTDKDRKR
ncbi:hypothetical protein ACFSX5_12155 [Devosia albogilva]|uniref:ABC-type sugar transport system, ATPase component n=1 Tax=Devosia albogilva TaxID=429726 RepID=A0ABW5QLR3_9HYPH